jgi:hypothetical protein
LASVGFTLFVGIVPGWLVSASKHATILSRAVGG